MSAQASGRAGGGEAGPRAGARLGAQAGAGDGASASADPARAARQAITCGSRSFAAAARLFDAPTRRSVELLYAWCRHCDDVIDGQDHGAPRPGGPAAVEGGHEPSVGELLGRVEALEHGTRRALRGATRGLATPFAGLAEVARRHRIPEALALQHLQGFRMDARGRHYRCLSDTLDYAWHVAGVVGVMMAMVMGRRDDATLASAADLGLAFQLTNIARDVLDDHRIGRVYLPAQWLLEAGLQREDIGRPEHRATLLRVARRLLEAAEPRYASARAGLARLPARSAWAVATAHRVYREIGLQLLRQGHAAWDTRASVSGASKLVLLGRGALDALASRRALARPFGGAFTGPCGVASSGPHTGRPTGPYTGPYTGPVSSPLCSPFTAEPPPLPAGTAAHAFLGSPGTPASPAGPGPATCAAQVPAAGGGDAPTTAGARQRLRWSAGSRHQGAPGCW